MIERPRRKVGLIDIALITGGICMIAYVIFSFIGHAPEDTKRLRDIDNQERLDRSLDMRQRLGR
jgi:hypothetical protein